MHTINVHQIHAASANHPTCRICFGSSAAASIFSPAPRPRSLHAARSSPAAAGMNSNTHLQGWHCTGSASACTMARQRFTARRRNARLKGEHPDRPPPPPACRRCKNASARESQKPAFISRLAMRLKRRRRTKRRSACSCPSHARFADAAAGHLGQNMQQRLLQRLAECTAMVKRQQRQDQTAIQ